LRKKYFKPEIKDFYSLTAFGQYPEGACTYGVNADSCNSGGGASSAPGTCESGEGAALACSSGTAASGGACDVGNNAQGQTGYCFSGTSPQYNCGPGSIPG
jgi:hypothetical protein